MKLAYYPGCSLSSTGIEFGMSAPVLAKALGLELWEIPEWNCCGSSSAHVTDHNLALALPARNLAIAEEAGLDVVVPCAACYARLKAAEAAVRSSRRTKEEIEKIIDRKYEAKITVRSLLDIIYTEIGPAKIREKVLRPLEGLRVAAYYGCLLVRPPKVAQFEDPENPVSMDRLLSAAGAEPVDWGYKTECCGGGHPTISPEFGLKILKPIYEEARYAGADCFVTACPMCFTNLDMRQKEVGKQHGTVYNLPVFYITELLGLALGFEARELGINRHLVNALPLLKHKGLLHPVKGGRE
ncbi:MAG: CoB--CoM heterodisulfide reductase iron-sulfur subunit B family protein [Peptococcaceae bacterium]|jgi:heterodisulfide reductase subunit B|nr:CoB--CoM heterodisulfide reductase iron-sulfur subunit B family protein [Peptococcaceae bacterium]MDH7525160.1 CoB--CoM heterodisulfide reductase iron-sulfur subunit B family protein [Peptococcaceae bacterium]